MPSGASAVRPAPGPFPLQPLPKRLPAQLDILAFKPVMAINPASERSILPLTPRGFCAGVVRAIDIVEVALKTYGAPIYVRKEIVHNRHVVSDLACQGAIFVEEVDEVPRGERLIYSAHGVSPAVRSAARERGLRVIDATCPLVTKVHLEAVRFAKQHATILLVGHSDHDEVIGTFGEAPERTIVVSSPEQARTVEVPEGSLAYLTQTTLSLDEAGAILGILKRRFPHIQAPPAKDICYATENRQQAVKRAGSEADLLLIVGSANSSNSQRLVEVGRQAGMESHLIDDERDIRPAWLEKASTVAVSAGASAPEIFVQRVIRFVQEAGFPQVRRLDGLRENVHFPLPPELRGSEHLTRIAPLP